MRKALVMGIAMAAILAFAAAPIFACGEESTANAEKASSTSYSCSASKGTSASLASSDSKGGFCYSTAAKDCAEKMGMTEEECIALCKSGKLTMVNMSIDGMTCGGCENSLTASLMKVPGVVYVNSISYKTGTASVYLDTRAGQSDAVVTAVTNKGYTAEIIPAVATSETTVSTKSANSKSGVGCSASKSACSSKKSSTTATTVKADGTK